jgi:hypothetical protein
MCSDKSNPKTELKLTVLPLPADPDQGLSDADKAEIVSPNFPQPTITLL